MKIALILVLFSSSVIGALGNTVKVESVSVMEGDSVTLHTGATKIQGSDSIEWRFNGTRMARIKSDSSSIEALFRGKIQLNNQTGDLKITNVRTTDSGLYKLNIKRSSGSSEMTFTVTVVISGVKSVSVKEGDSVTLRSGVNKQRDDVIQWRHQNLLVAEYNIIPTYDTNKSFKLDDQTGSLTITNITTEHTGDYQVEISSSRRYTIHKSFSVNVSDELESVSVTERDSATLNSGLTEIQRDGVIRWSFRKTIIAEIIKADEEFSTDDDVLDGRFRDRLKLDKKTGSLTITNTRNKDSGEYEVEISSSRFIVHKRISVTVNELESVSVTERDSATLNSGLTEIQRDGVIRWSFRKTIIAEIIKADEQFFIHDGPDGRFRGRLKLDHQTGSLNITNTRNKDSGEYEVKISSSRFIVHKRISVTVNETVDLVLLMEGDSVTLHTGVIKIPKDDTVLWYGDKGARITPSPGSVDARWSNTEQNNQTGDLTIRNIRRDQSGDYNVNFSNSSSMNVHRKFHLNITGVNADPVKKVLGTVGESVTLKTEKQSDEVMQWRFGSQNTVIAELKVPADRFTVYDDVLDGRFRDRLELDDDTGSLNITDIRTTDSGVYEAEIRGSGHTIHETFSVTVRDSGLSPAAPDSGLSPGAVAGIVVAVLLVFATVGVIYYRRKCSKTETHSEVNGQNHTSNEEEETKLTRPAEAAE